MLKIREYQLPTLIPGERFKLSIPSIGSFLTAKLVLGCPTLYLTGNTVAPDIEVEFMVVETGAELDDEKELLNFVGTFEVPVPIPAENGGGGTLVVRHLVMVQPLPEQVDDGDAEAFFQALMSGQLPEGVVVPAFDAEQPELEPGETVQAEFVLAGASVTPTA